MLTFTTSTMRQALSELRLLTYSRYLHVILAVLAVGVIISFTGSVSAARSAHTSFVREVATYESNGVTLAEALAAPMSVTTDGDQETIDNPLKYDYLELGKSVHAVQGMAMIGTALDLVTFIVIPLLFLIVGSYLSNVDRLARTALFRAARERWVAVTAGKVVTIGVLAVIAPVTVAVVALAAGAIGSGSVASLTARIGFDLVYPSTQSPLALKMVATAGVCLLFGVFGYAIGFITRSISWPMILAAAALFLVPFVSAWDPRNLMAVVGSQVYDFWGQFQMRPPIPLPTATAAITLGVYLVVGMAVVIASSRVVRLR